ncbi:hypothetical protein PIROE2DRAFT_8095 [Piromyces sp. E2]|nr:hypothetical protein PIROE2DRAFT_8095 [Piromyces sp. E2]|eukprot:OUM64952.1 hypothetical protein PIROE2DRAFT_8095 [Piromyces sp. E2]
MSYISSKYSKKCQDIYAEMGGIAQEAFTQIRTIVSFGREEDEYKRYANKLEPSRKYSVIKAHSFGITVGMMMGLLYCSYFIAFSHGARLIFNNEMNAGDVLNVFFNVTMGTSGLTSIGDSINTISKATGAARKLFAIIERKSKDITKGKFRPDKNLKGIIEFKEVHFTYPSRPNVEVLKGVSFTCQPGQTIALVGSSGSGKSTIVQLLEQFYTSYLGTILIDGKDIKEYDIHWLRTQIGLVSQEPTLFASTIGENIAMAYPNSTQKQIEKAAKLANAHDFISRLPNGYETSTGERGLHLSGGQKQRICLARAIISDPKILLLDEATSALDNQSEKIVQKALDSASCGRTTIIVAHRLTTIKNADCILVMNKGVITEYGTHEELMEKKSFYYNLVKNQEIKIMNELKDLQGNDKGQIDHDGNNEDITDFFKDKNTTNTTSENVNENKNEDENDMVVHITKTLSHVSTISNLNLSPSTKKITNDNKKNKIQKLSNVSMNWKRFLGYNKSIWFPNVMGLVGSFLIGLSQSFYAFIFGNATDMFTKQNDDLLQEGKRWGLMFIIFGLVMLISFYLQVGGFSSAGEFLSLNFRKEMYNSLIHQEVGYFDTIDIGDGSEQATGGIDNIEEKEVNTGTLTAKLASEASLIQELNISAGYLIEIVIGITCCIGTALYCSWKLTLCLLLLSPLIGIAMYIEVKALQEKDEQLRSIYENSSSIACDAISNIKTVYAFNLESRFCTIYDEYLYQPMKKMEKKFYLSSLGPALNNAVDYIINAIGFYIGGIFILHEWATFENEMMVLMAIILAGSTAGKASLIAPNYTKAVNAFNHVMEIIDRQPKIDSRDSSGITKKTEELKCDLAFKELRFRYPSRPNIVVLQMGNDSIEIPEGKVCAIVGGSGSGKSTIIGLLPRWYDAHHGSILVDGEENKNYNIKYLREQIGFVSQEPNLFNISIIDNIKYGKKDATDEEVYEAAKKANIHNFILSLPEGYNTVIGGISTTQLSGGQKQRIAIARAIIRNPKILLLDEATSALDAESEVKVQKALDEASIGRSTIVVAHRLSTIKNADLIVVMKNGRIIEKGTHEQLMNLKKEYYQMVLVGDNGLH